MNVRRSALAVCLVAALTATPGLADSTKPAAQAPADKSAKHAPADKPAKLGKSAQAGLTDQAAKSDGATKTAKSAKAKQAAGSTKTVKDAKGVTAIRKRAAPRSMRQALQRMKGIRVNVDFKELEFSKVVRFIGNVAGFDVIVSPELQAKGMADVVPITLKLRNVTVKQLAELVERFSKTKMHFKKGILEFTTPKAARGKPVMRIYSIGEITTPMRHFPGPDINLYPAGTEFEPEEESLVESAFGDADRVAELIQTTIDAESWEDENTSIQAYTGKLIVKTYPHVHRQVLRFLNQLRAHR